MCGGLRDMQSSSPPPRLLLDDMKPHIAAAAADGLQLMITSCRHLHVPASPAGLAIVAALETELIRSGSATSRNSASSSSSSSSSPPLPIPTSSSSSSADHEEINYEAYNNYTYKNQKNDDDTVKIHNRGAQKSTIFYTSLSPPYRERSYEYDFLGVCFSCNRPLGPGKDVYMYRGDRAFCSTECRYKNIAADESLQCSIQINQQCVQASSPTNQPKFMPQVAIPILV